MPGIATYRRAEFDVAALVDEKVRAGRRVSVVIPARDEESTIGAIVAAIRDALVDAVPLVDEILVADDRSVDATAREAVAGGARVVATDDGAGERGKGDALWRGVRASTGDVLAFVDGDLVDFDPGFVVGLLGPLLTARCGDVSFVKGFYERPLDGAPRGGGRVTELAARPIIAILLDHLDGIVQPLAGEFAARRDVLERLPFVRGYGVDIALLADAARTFGVETIAQVDLGRRQHRNRPLEELGPMAAEVLLAALSRAGVAVPESVELTVPGAGTSIVSVAERPPLVGPV